MDRKTNVKKHPRQLKSGRTKVKRHKRRVPFHKKQMTIDKGDYEHYYNQKSKRAKTMDEKSTAKKTHKGEVLNIPYRKNRNSQETRNYLIKKTGQMDWEGVDTKKNMGKIDSKILTLVEKYNSNEGNETFQKLDEIETSLHLENKTDNWGNQMTVYELSDTVDSKDWYKISQYMEKSYYYDGDSEGDEMVFNGWQIKKGHEKDVERILGIRYSYTEKKDLEKKAFNIRQKFSKIRSELNTELQKYDFKNYPMKKEQIKTSGDKYYQSTRDMNTIYGGGKWWVIDKRNNKIWSVRNNGMDGDDWSRNNIATGGAGAIGFNTEYNPNLELLIKTIGIKDN